MRRLFFISVVVLALAGWFLAHQAAGVVQNAVDSKASKLASIDEG
jgi:hypothetical protein